MKREKKEDILGKFGIHIINMDSPEYKYGITHAQAVKRRWIIALLWLIAIALWFVPAVLFRGAEETILGALLFRAFVAFCVFCSSPVLAGGLTIICRICYGIYKWILRITMTRYGPDSVDGRPVDWESFFNVLTIASLVFFYILGVKDLFFYKPIVSALNGRVYYY